MSTVCQFCDGTGSLSKWIAGFLDCPHCDTATKRMEFEAWAAKEKLLGGGVINAWLIFQHGKSSNNTEK